MKKRFAPLLIALISLSSVGAIAQKKTEQKTILPIDTLTKLITYQEVVNVDGASKDELYTRAREWFAKTFVSAQDVLQMDDRQAGKVIGKGSSKGFYLVLLSPVEYYLKYTVAITVKEGRYRYEISSFHVDTPPSKASKGSDRPAESHNELYLTGKGLGYGTTKKIIPHIDTTSSFLSASIKESLQQPAIGIKSKDDF